MAKTPKKYLDLDGLSYYNNTYINTIVNAVDITKQDKNKIIDCDLTEYSNIFQFLMHLEELPSTGGSIELPSSYISIPEGLLSSLMTDSNTFANQSIYFFLHAKIFQSNINLIFPLTTMIILEKKGIYGCSFSDQQNYYIKGILGTNNEITWTISCLQTQIEIEPDIVYDLTNSPITCNKNYNEIVTLINQRQTSGKLITAVATGLNTLAMTSEITLVNNTIVYFSIGLLNSNLGIVHLEHADNEAIDVHLYPYIEDISQLSDINNLIPTDISNLSDASNLIPTDINQLSDEDNLLSGSEPDLSGYATEEYVDNSIPDLNGYATEEYVNNAIPTSVSELSDASNYVTQTDLNTALAQAASGVLKRLIVSTLPISNIDTNTIYMIAKTTSLTNNAYNEFMYINNQWELIGDTDTVVTVDSVITQNSNNAVSSGAVYAAIGNIESALEALL